MSKTNPEDVFTPRTIPKRAMFEKRNQRGSDGSPGVQERLQDALAERGGQVLIYGDTGVGKSSLLMYAAEDMGLGQVLVECDATMNYDSILDFAIRELVDVREISRTSHKSGSLEMAAGGQVMPWIARISGKLSGSLESDRTFEVTEQSALSVLAEAMERSGRSLIVLDNFQNVPKEARERVSQGLETLSDRAGRDHRAPDFKFIVIGIAADAASLLGTSLSYGRRTSEINVPRMSSGEIREILSTGFRILGLTIAEDDLEALATHSDGFPYFAHLLGLNVAREAVRDGSQVIDQQLIGKALRRSAHAVAASYASRVESAEEVGGVVQPRKTILRLLASSSRKSWSGAEVVEMWTGAVGKVDAPAFIHTAVSQLTQEKYGKILTRSGVPRRYIYSFGDPHMRPYLRIRGQAGGH